MNTKALTPSENTSPIFDLSAIENANLQDSTREKYKRAITNYLETGAQLGDFGSMEQYARGLTQSGRAFFKAAVRLMTEAYELQLKSGATPENIGQVQAGLYRLQSLREAVKVRKSKGTKAHIWLSRSQVEEITAACNYAGSLEGKRDWIVLSLLLGAGLRREELTGLTFDAIKRQPKKKNGGMRDVLQVAGKGAKDRVIPINPLLAERLREWRSIVGGGQVARSLDRWGKLGDSLSAAGIFTIVRKYGAKVGVDGLDPHDCRRTFAQLAYEAGIPITQISVLLGHSSIDVTQKYLDLSLDLEVTASDFIPLSGD